jgi:anti-anti-sigma factor
MNTTMDSFRCARRAVGGVELVEVAGEIGRPTVRTLREVLDAAIYVDSHDIAVDVSAVTSIGLPGLTALVVARERATEDGRSFILLRPSAAVRRALTVTGLDLLLPFAEELTDRARDIGRRRRMRPDALRPRLSWA